jgi:pyruvate dehydrogenase E1 component beta subunit
VDHVTQVNEALRAELAKFESSVVYGQNINAGSRLGGLAAGMSDISGCKVLNTPNVENSLVGMGFGLMLSGTPSMYVMKQQDFVLLGVDQLVNTWNALQSRGPFVPFVIAMIVVDNGWEGPQSSFNNTSGIASLARMPAYFPSGAAEIPLAVTGAFQGGPAILSVSQRLFKQEPIAADSDSAITATDSYVVYRNETASSTAPMLAILCTNFTIDYAWLIREHAKERGYAVTVVSYFALVDGADAQLLGICSAAESVVVLDDSKSGIGRGTMIATELQVRLPSARIKTVVRQDTSEWYLPREDFLSIDVQSIFANQIEETHGRGPAGKRSI